MSASIAPPPSAPVAARQRYLELISGQRRGPLAVLSRGGLWVASWFYGVGVRLRNLAYQRGWKRSERAEVPVVSVGNLTVGGTGKTPCVEYVAGFYRQRDRCVAILSRGYGSSEGVNDEALLLEENLPDVPHLQGADRVALARVAVEELESEILVLDDGFQHRRLVRDLDLVLIDATQPWGHGYLLPRGLLREPMSGLRRGHAIVLTRCDQVGPDTLASLRRQVERLAPNVPVVEAIHQPAMLIGQGERTAALEQLEQHPVAAFCGIGNPEAFRRTLEDLGARIVATRWFPDHHAYDRADVQGLRDWARGLPREALLVTTQKDLVKLRVDELGGRPLWALRIRLAIRAGQAELDALLERVLTR